MVRSVRKLKLLTLTTEAALRWPLRTAGPKDGAHHALSQQRDRQRCIFSAHLSVCIFRKGLTAEPLGPEPRLPTERMLRSELEASGTR